MRIATKTTSPKYPLDLSDLEDTVERIKEAYERVKSMVILTIYYLDSSDNPVSWSTDPMDVGTAMDRVMRFVQAGADVINHYGTGRMDVVLLHRVTGMTITPAG